jgi:hypothetical protein
LDLFQSLASELVSPSIQIYSSNEADKAARDFVASRALTYRLSTRENTKVKVEVQNTWP